MELKHIIKKLIGPTLSHKIGTKIFFARNRNIRQLIEVNTDYKGIHNGKRCFIFGNGPSLKKIDFSLFENEYTFTVNQLPKNPNFSKLKTTYHVWADENFFMLDSERIEDLEVIKTMKRVNTPGNNPKVFYKTSACEMIHKFDLDSELKIGYYAQGCWENWKYNNYIDFSEPVPGFSTVTHYCILLAVYMGFSEIYLLGCDCTGIINAIEGWMNVDNSNFQKLEYAFEMSKEDKRISQRGHMNCSIRDEFLGWARLFDDYKKLYQYCLDKNVKLFNATNPTLLQTVPKIDLEDVLKSK